MKDPFTQGLAQLKKSSLKHNTGPYQLKDSRRMLSIHPISLQINWNLRYLSVHALFVGIHSLISY